jgi:hypothetical protein
MKKPTLKQRLGSETPAFFKKAAWVIGSLGGLAVVIGGSFIGSSYIMSEEMAKMYFDWGTHLVTFGTAFGSAGVFVAKLVYKDKA